MLLDMLVLLDSILKMQLFQINQSEDSSKITIMSDTTCGQLHQRPITSASNYNRITLHLNPNLLTSTLAVSEGCFHGENIIVIRYFRAVVTTLLYNRTTFKPSHAGLPASARRFSEIHTPHNLLPQQIVREEAIVYCQSINNLDC